MVTKIRREGAGERAQKVKGLAVQACAKVLSFEGHTKVKGRTRNIDLAHLKVSKMKLS